MQILLQMMSTGQQQHLPLKLMGAWPGRHYWFTARGGGRGEGGGVAVAVTCGEAENSRGEFFR